MQDSGEEPITPFEVAVEEVRQICPGDFFRSKIAATCIVRSLVDLFDDMLSQREVGRQERE